VRLPKAIEYAEGDSDNFAGIELPDGRLLSLDCADSEDDAAFLREVVTRYNAHQWRPINTVPERIKNTQAWILVAFLHGSYGVVADVAYWIASATLPEGGYWHSPGAIGTAATHWTPLPDRSGLKPRKEKKCQN